MCDIPIARAREYRYNIMRDSMPGVLIFDLFSFFLFAMTKSTFFFFFVERGDARMLYF